MNSWLVTGATGSFGHAFVQRLLTDDLASRIVVLSRDELKQAHMRATFGDDPRLRFFIGSVSDRDRVELAMRGIERVVHAAAMKRVETCEANPAEAVATNVNGTREVARAAIQAGVEKAVFLSTDKAAAPNTLYGATKLTAERLWTQSNVYAAGTPTRLSATRYGNVVGSRGSVVKLFQAQAERGDTLTLTDPSMTRFWMRLEEAVDLVLLAFQEMRGGEVFVPKIPSASIETVADAIAPLQTRTVIGIRRGEKIHETLISEDEARYTVEHDDHYRIEPERTWEDDTPPVEGLPDGFIYRSDSNPDQLSPERFRELVA